MTIDFNKLKKAVMDYYGTAMTNGFPMAVIELGEAESVTPETIKKLLELATEAGFRLEDFAIDDYDLDR